MLLCGRNTEMTYVWTLPSVITESGNMWKKGIDAVRETEMKEYVSSEMGKVTSWCLQRRLYGIRP